MYLRLCLGVSASEDHIGVLLANELLVDGE